MISAHPHLYQLSARPWLYDLEQRTGEKYTLATIPDAELDDISSRGITHLYLLGVWRLGQAALDMDLATDFSDSLPGCTPGSPDIIGSPFAIVEYTLNPELGQPAELRSLRERLALRGIGLILDFVPNHCAPDAPEVSDPTDATLLRGTPTYMKTHPHRFNEEGIAYGGCDEWVWKDTCNYNYWSPEFRRVTIQRMMSIAEQCDGMRVDVAMSGIESKFEENWGELLFDPDFPWTKPDKEFWLECITAVKEKFPECFFIAEQFKHFGPVLVENGFDYYYAKGLTSALRTGPAKRVRGHLERAGKDIWRACHFTCNHDEIQLPNFITETNPLPRLCAAIAITQLCPGFNFTWMGDWEGEYGRLEIHLRRRAEQGAVDGTREWVQMRIVPCLVDDVFREGKGRFAPEIGAEDQAVAFDWTHGSTRAVAVINYSDREMAHGLKGEDFITGEEVPEVLPAWGVAVIRMID